MKTKPMSLTMAKEIAGNCGFSLRRNQFGELRLAPRDGKPAEREAQAYYTADLEDAVGTALQEFDRRRVRKDRAMIENPKAWPRWPALPLKPRRGTDHAWGFIVADNPLIVYFGNIMSTIEVAVGISNGNGGKPAQWSEVVSHFEHERFADLDALLAIYTVD